MAQSKRISNASKSAPKPLFGPFSKFKRNDYLVYPAIQPDLLESYFFIHRPRIRLTW